MKKSFVSISILSVSLILFCGCPAKQENPSTTPPQSVSHADAGHNHDFGPDGGSLAVLGSHQFHAEAIANEASGDVEIRIYTSSNQPTSVDAKDIKLNRIVGGQPKQYTLLLIEGGKTATFKINDPELAETVHDRTWDGDLQMSLLVADVPCNGSFSKKKSIGDDHGGHKH